MNGAPTYELVSSPLSSIAHPHHRVPLGARLVAEIVRVAELPHTP
ncbi:hypothetical protein ACP70R_002750 [Stipagrostis hirtigluma subsp. patula]